MILNKITQTLTPEERAEVTEDMINMVIDHAIETNDPTLQDSANCVNTWISILLEEN